METSSHNLATPWRFRDGTEYLVSLGLHESPKSMSLLLSDKITAEEWTGDFDVKYIENLTQRTGNYKPFDTFHAMIKSAILKKSGAVALDLMSYEDLLALRSQKKRMGQASVTSINDFLLGPNLANNSVGSGSGNENPPESQPDTINWQESTTMAGPKPKKYIIITYIAEFDKVHYPLPLKYTGYPDASVMQQTIHKLKKEVDQLKFTNTELFAQLKSLLKANNGRNFPSSTKSRINKSQGRTGSRSRPRRRPLDKNANPQIDASLSDPTSEVEAEADVEGAEGDEDDEDVYRDTMDADIDTMRFSQSNKKSNKYKYQKGNGNGSSYESIQSLGSMVQRLESLIEDERVSHSGKMSKLEKENDYLRCQLKSVENSESLLKDKVGRLESVLAMNVGLTKRKSSNLKEVYRSPYGRERSRTITPNQSSPHRSLLLSKTKIRSQNDENVRPNNKVPVPSSRRCKQNSRVPSSRNISTSRSRDSSIASGCIYNKGNRNEPERGAHQKMHNAHYLGQSSRNVSASSRSRSRDGNKTAFNPTEYVKQKRMKQESMAQLRLAKVESRLKNNKSRQKVLAEDHGNFRRNHPSEEAVSVDGRRRSSSLRSTATFTTGNSNLGSNPRQKSMLDPGNKEINYGRRLSVESGQHSLKGTRSPSVHSRRISPSPSRPKTSGMETSERRSRNKIRDHNTLSKNKKVGRMSIHEILESARKDYNRKDEAKQKQDKMLFNTKKSEAYRSWKIEPMSNADSIYDGLERRLNTIHTFLEKNHSHKSKG